MNPYSSKLFENVSYYVIMIQQMIFLFLGPPLLTFPVLVITLFDLLESIE